MHVDDEGASGCRAFFGGGPTPGSTAAYQDIDVSGAASEIDTGNLTANMTARVGRLGNTDFYGEARLEFLPLVGDVPVASPVSIADTMQTTVSRLVTGSKTFNVPKETRRFRVRILGVLGEEGGPENTGYVDDVGLTLDGSDPAATAPPAGCTGGSATTGATSGITATGATVSGQVAPGLDLTRYRFQYGTSTGYGLASSDGEANPASGPIPVSAALTGLQPDTVYHYRLVAESPLPGGSSALYAPPSTGVDVAFRTLPGAKPSSGKRQAHRRSISIRYAGGRFRGKISSSADCRAGKVKVFRVRRGADPQVAAGRAGADGKWSAKKDVDSGRYFARAGRRAVQGDVCPAVKSRTLILG
jgi:hypothetical protein